eukprot:TRINITY_DN47_c0_g2_i2.p1 TRINITY_DN47_c0_g2~~TRINITY_DN47_c0_g2_i2.p1  ORF type:complete len:574 (-),score=115.26 TRINITY_DN47_c0_g2_i2:211-1932(-)
MSQYGMGFNAPNAIGTGLRPGSGIKGPPNLQSVGMMADVQITDRPVTQQGMMGLKTASGNRERQYKDNAYFMSELSNRSVQMGKEMDRLKAVMEQKQKDNSEYSRLERQYEDLIKKVRKLEGELADYNLSSDKARSGTDASEIVAYGNMLKERNQKETEEVDELYIQSEQRRQYTLGLEKQILDIDNSIQNRFASEAPHMEQEYKALLEAIAALQPETDENKMRLYQIQQQRDLIYEQLDSDGMNSRFSDEQRKNARYASKLAELQNEAASASQDPEEIRKQLLQTVRTNNEKLQEIEAEVRNKQGERNKTNRRVEQMENQLERASSKSDSQPKFEVLFQRDQEMTEFLDKFPDQKHQVIQQTAKDQAMIVAMLEAMSSTLVSADNSVQAKLEFKEKQLQASKDTRGRLETEYQKRKAELDKLTGIGSKVSLEMSSLRAKIDTMDEEIHDFGKVGELKDQHQRISQQLQLNKQKYIRRMNSMKQQLPIVSGKIDRMKNELEEDEIFANLENQEQKLKHIAQSIHTSKEFIDTKKVETDYSQFADECQNLVDSQNAMLIKSQIHAPSQLSTTPY